MAGSDNTHARLSPSDASRWAHCTAAIGFEEEHRSELPKDDETIYNIEGTIAHDYAEKVLLGEMKLLEIPENGALTTWKGKPFQLGADFRDAVAIYVQTCRLIEAETEGMEPFVEARVPLHYQKDEKGTMDFAMVSEDRIRVRDYKHGAGIYVEVVENEQLAIYALSFAEWLQDEGFYDFDPDTEIEIGIVQPRHREWSSDHLWVLTLADLRAFCEDITAAVEIVREGLDTKFDPGKACKWCKAKAICEARLDFLANGLPAAEEGDQARFLEEMPETDGDTAEDRLEECFGGSIDPATLVKIFENKKGIITFLSDVEEYLEARATDGKPIPGTKLVMGREGNRKWVDEDSVKTMLRNQGFKKSEYVKESVVTITQAEKLLGDKVNVKKKKNPELSPKLARRFHEDLISRSPAKKVLALAGDHRPAVDADISDMPELPEIDEEDI